MLLRRERGVIAFADRLAAKKDPFLLHTGRVYEELGV